jgi:acyl carrier protein
LAQATSTRTRRALLQKQVRREVGQVLRIAPAQVDPVAALRSLGLDSLTSLELKNRLEARLGLTLSTTLIWNYPTVDALVEVLIDALDMSWGGMPEGTLGGNGAKAVAPPVPKEVSTGLTRSDVEGMDNDEVERQLAQHLARLGMEEVVL